MEEKTAAPPVSAVEATAAQVPAEATAAQVPAEAKNQLEISGVPGGAFAAYGTGFSQKGTLTFGDRTVETTGWYTNPETSITKVKAVVPSDIKRGSTVTIKSAGKTFTGKL